jgi:hypothetical protein
MGYAFVIGGCVTCGRLMTFNPLYVPSVRVKGVREPVCRACVERANPERRRRGLPEIALHPQAYEPCDETELLLQGEDDD